MCLYIHVMQVTKDAVSNFQVGRRIPHCAFELQLLDGKTRRLLHRVNLTGVAYPEFFYIRYPQPEGELILYTEQSLCIKPGSHYATGA